MDKLRLIPFTGEKLLNVSSHHSRLAQRCVISAEHMLSDLVGAPASRFDLQKMSVKIFQIVVHSLEVFPALDERGLR